ncbi:hypothetical protein MBLNU457_5301t1 [Dothideomycetes sp. NU457]
MAPNDKKPLPQLAKEKLENNPSALGDPVSLKAEKSNTEPTEKDRPNKNGGQDSNKKSLKEIAEEKLKNNPSALGDPVSMKAESADSHPTEQDRGAAPADPKNPKKDSKL